MTRFRISVATLALAVALGMLQVADTTVLASGQSPAVQSQEQQMMQMHQKMMADRKAMDDRLNGLVARMKSARGDAKVDAIAEVVTALVEQRASMGGGMMGMQPEMMQHMSAMSPEMKKMMEACPMMKMMGKGK